MSTEVKPITVKHPATATSPSYVTHESFKEPHAEQVYRPGKVVQADYGSGYMPDEVTREQTKQMHYAAYRVAIARDERVRERWRGIYLGCRDQVVLGNRKLIFRAVRRWSPVQAMADDMAGDCHIVLIQAVAAYNPWIGVRFSTYAFTCLMRALSRLSQRHAADRLSKSVPLDVLPDGEPRDGSTEEKPAVSMPRLDVYLQESHALLSMREKMVLQRRFSLDERVKSGTLEQVGRELGLSKERVRQVQASAIDKLRKELLATGIA